MEELRVPKRAVQVELTLQDGVSRKVEIYLSEFASNHAGGERLSEMLNTDVFLAARDLQLNKVSLLNSASVMVARVAREVEATDDAEAHTIPTEHDVEVTLHGRAVIRGLLSYVLPPERARLVDYLNSCPRFIPLLEADQLALINRSYIAAVNVVR